MNRVNVLTTNLLNVLPGFVTFDLAFPAHGFTTSWKLLCVDEIPGTVSLR